ncbi:MAG: pyridoxamine 5'-phosphate oxidase family protein [Syntrophaceae bacterium]|nr:pyridoxamine 5'-phosphate oxidase family protein [Syntrophaceae bacterium]
MNLAEYFENTLGYGVLSTADKNGRVDVAMYARPRFTDDTTVVFIMLERLTHANLQENPYAAYLFLEKGPGYKGKRLYLKKIREEENDDMVKELCRRCGYSEYREQLSRYVVFFSVEKVLPLVGTR